MHAGQERSVRRGRGLAASAAPVDFTKVLSVIHSSDEYEQISSSVTKCLVVNLEIASIQESMS